MLHRLEALEAGDPGASPSAFLFAPKPNVTLDRSPEPEAPSTDSTTDDILENPALGAGEPVVLPGAGLADNDAFGAGTVMNPLPFPFAAAFFFFFSVLPLASG